MMLRAGLVLSLAMMTWSCSGDDDTQPKEPVAAEQDTNKVPDAPGAGDTGEAAAKPAGEGQAAAMPAAAAPAEKPAAPEKSTPNAEAAKAASAPGDMMVKAGALNVRKGPGTKNAVLRTLKRGEKVSPMGCEKGWCKIAEGEYVSKKYLEAAK